ncbi:MAG: hypothetical protein HY535_03835 [Chloroflexi bacterium]|nr:hypothetical protein [Chloroflexota bacterium]
MNSRRSQAEILAEILRLGEASKTEIMFSANMSFRQLQKYLDFLVGRGFLAKRVVPNPGVKYVVTDKGAHLLTRIEAMLRLMEQGE